MPNDLFAGSDNESQDTKDFYAELVGEGKKFKDNQALARGKYLADQTVEEMKARLDELRADYQTLQQTREAGATLKDLVDQLKTQKPSEGNFTPTAKDENVQPTAEDFKAQAKAAYAEIRAAEIADQNLNIVLQRLREEHGENYQSALQAQRENLHLTNDEVNALARRSPEAFFRVMGMTGQRQDNTFQTPPKSAMRSDSFSPTTNKRTWTYYQNLKKTDRNLYYSPKIFNQMLKDAEDLGPAFKDGDYSAFGD